MEVARGLHLAHLVEAMGGNQHIWGKERVIQLLMHEQRASGIIVPSLITFSPGTLSAALAADGFATSVLSQERIRPGETLLSQLSRVLARDRVSALHTHGYKANIVARALRVSGMARGISIVSTCHGWSNADAKLRFYNAMDRWTGFISDVTTVPDADMIAAFPRTARTVHVPNGVPDFGPDGAPKPEDLNLGAAGVFVAGTLGRVNEEKGIFDLLEAARTCTDPTIVFTVAGAGALVPKVEAATPNVRFAGFFPDPRAYLERLDVYVQASHMEGLSIALLEAMRAGKAIVATPAGGTCDAVSDGHSALIVPPHSPQALRDAIQRLRRDPALREQLGRNARARFTRDFRVDRQHQQFAALYAGGKTR